MSALDVLSWLKIVGGVADARTASLTGDLSQRDKAAIARILQSTSPGLSPVAAGSLGEQIQYLVTNLPAAVVVPVKAVYSTASPEAIGQEIMLPGATTWVASAVLTQNLAYFIPVVIPGAFTLARFIWRNGGTVNGNVRMALFSSAGVKQGTDTGSVAQTGTSTIQAAAPSGGSFAVAAGRYYMAFSSDSATAEFSQWGSSSVTPRMMGAQSQAADYAMATPATFAAAAATVPWIGISQLTTN